jgi:hypothetical protein
MAIGGGFDIPVSKSFEIRPVEIDYLMTRFTNQVNNSSQNNFRYSGSVVSGPAQRQVSHPCWRTRQDCKGTDAASPTRRLFGWRSCPQPRNTPHLLGVSERYSDFSPTMATASTIVYAPGRTSCRNAIESSGRRP